MVRISFSVNPDLLRFWYLDSSALQNSKSFLACTLSAINPNPSEFPDSSNKKRKTPPIMHIERGSICRNTSSKSHRSGEGLKFLSSNHDTLWFLHHQPCNRSQSHHVGRINIIRIGACGSPFDLISKANHRMPQRNISGNALSMTGLLSFEIWHAM